jgi:hypothetical protein
MKGAVHIGGESWACSPISRARAFSRAIRASTAGSGRVKLLSTPSGCATGGGTFGRLKRIRAVSVCPDARVISAFAAITPSVSTGTPPIACQVPAPAAMKCKGSPASDPLMLTTLSADPCGAVKVSRTTAPGSGLAGDTTRRGACAAAADPKTRPHAARMLWSFNVYLKYREGRAIDNVWRTPQSPR